MKLLMAAYLTLFAAEAVKSYNSPPYRFNGAALMISLGFLGAAVTLSWWRREVPMRAWWLPFGLVLLGLGSFPESSLDPLRYLFDGEMIRVWHMSPYLHLPHELPLDQYSKIFDHIWWTAIPSPYGPLWQALMVAINFFSGNRVVGGMILLKLINLGGLLLCARYVYLISRQKWASYLVLVNPVILINTVATPHPDIVIAAGVLAAYFHSNVVGKSVSLATAALIKLHALIFLPFLTKGWRNEALLGGVFVLITAGMLVALKPLIGFDWLPMLRAGQAGGVTGMRSLLIYNLFPGMSVQNITIASYGLFAAGYVALGYAYWRGKISQLLALAGVSLLVPFCLTGVLLPWHFILPIVFLVLIGGRLAIAAIGFFSALVLRSAVTVNEILLLAGLFGAGYAVTRWALLNAEVRPPVIDRVAAFFYSD